MSVEVIIPSLRQSEPERLVWSLSRQTHPPDVVTVVSNEAQPFSNYGIKARLLRFSSSEYGVGDLDVALRQNVGIWSTECDFLIIQGDDQIAPPKMVEDTLAEIERRGEYVWGNHRLTDFSDKTAEEILNMPMEAGVSRESGAPTWHGPWSCYGGMFGIKTDLLREIGGFDMAFNGRHGSEDQALGFRLMTRAGQNKVWISEPPFSWHPIELRQGDTRARSPWLPPIKNGCQTEADHQFGESKINGVSYLQCSKCPVWRFSDVGSLFRAEVLIRYRPELVQTMSVWL